MNASDSELRDVLTRIAAALERMAPPARAKPDFASCVAARWRSSSTSCYLEAVQHVHRMDADWLIGVEQQHQMIDRNTKQFVDGKPANNVLLTGSRGTGKSSLVKAMLTRYSERGLRLIEVEKEHLNDLPDIVDQIANEPYRFLIFCDDLSFDAGDGSYKALKAILDGSIAASTPNVMLYATSNRRHLLPEYFHENEETKYVGEEVHFGESVEEKVSLSERFGLWISFYPFSQEEYLAAVRSWIVQLGGAVSLDATAQAALDRDSLQWALQRGSRSGRVAYQYAKDFVGRNEREL
ncbi:MAG: ATP-binding protein [Burkholderiales bacterium]|nr:MAG: ATP-binding protein [Burkholderiales bacterium]TAG81730.1 MAG: ATP-binding protein [Betaproteobacteria bacterium]